jgi:hypothetical protein
MRFKMILSATLIVDTLVTVQSRSHHILSNFQDDTDNQNVQNNNSACFFVGVVSYSWERLNYKCQKIYGPDKDKVSGQFKILYNKKIHTLCRLGWIKQSIAVDCTCSLGRRHKK